MGGNFLDSNVLFSAAREPTSRLRIIWNRKRLKLLTSAYCVEESRRNLAADRPERLADLAELLQAVTIVAEAAAGMALPAGMMLPEKDRPVFLAAMQAGASRFVTGDKRHFGPYRGKLLGGALVLTPADFLAELRV